MSAPGDDPGLELLPNDVEKVRRGFEEGERERLEGFRNTAWDSGDFGAGEEGLLPIRTS